MSSSSISDSFQSNKTANAAPDLHHLAALLSSVADGTDSVEKEVANMKDLQNSISDYKSSHISRTKETQEKVSELAREIGIMGKNMVSDSDEKIKKFVEFTEPYTNSGIAAEHNGYPAAAMNKCIELKGAVKGIKSAIEKNQKMGPTVLKHHNQLKQIEETARKALATQEKLARIKRLSNEFPPSSPLHQLIVLSKLLLSLESSPEVSDYYKKKFGELEERNSLLFEAMSDYVPPNIGQIASILSTNSSLSNGEINLSSIRDQDEIPIDTSEFSGASD